MPRAVRARSISLIVRGCVCAVLPPAEIDHWGGGAELSPRLRTQGADSGASSSSQHVRRWGRISLSCCEGSLARIVQERERKEKARREKKKRVTQKDGGTHLRNRTTAGMPPTPTCRRRRSARGTSLSPTACCVRFGRSPDWLWTRPSRYSFVQIDRSPSPLSCPPCPTSTLPDRAVSEWGGVVIR